MDVLLLGASGRIGHRIADELLARDHSVTGVSRSGSVEDIDAADFVAVEGDATDPGDVAKLGGAYNVFGDLGAILGPIIALPVASNVGFDAVYFGCAGVAILATILVVKTLGFAAPTLGSTISE